MNENDLRVIKTRESIENTFLRLLETEGFAHISVAQIVKECRIAKGTFYYHYRDKYDLAEQLLRKQFSVFDTLFAGSQKALAEGSDDITQLTMIANDAAASYGRLSSIRTPELDAREELRKYLEARYLKTIQGQGAGAIRNPKQVAAFLAAVVVTQVDMMNAGESAAGSQFIDSLQDLATYISCMRISVGHA